ncbi:MAG: hypothetical protein GKR77_04405 [Legionellales bacterium]|nr:hypothetical protein [Legionellales bacterium]
MLRKRGRYLIHHLCYPLVKWASQSSQLKTSYQRTLKKIPIVRTCIQTILNQIFLLYQAYLHREPPVTTTLTQQIHQRLLLTIQTQRCKQDATTD